MATNGALKKKLGLLDLTLLGIGSMIGSGWLYSALNSAGYAGYLSGWAWALGAVIVLVIGLIFAELSASIPRAGGFVRYPQYTHGNIVGFVIGVGAILAYTSVAGVEVEAVRQYATYWWPALGQGKDNVPTVLGFAVQILLLVAFFLLNYWSVNVFGHVNTLVTAIKFIVPTIVIIVFLCYFNGNNLHVPSHTPGGMHGMFQALTGAGIVFSYLGFRQSVDFASEAKNPQRDVPLAILFALIASFIVYLLLQFAFMGAVPSDLLSANGWHGLIDILQSPYADLAKSLGITWLVSLILIDAVISPAGTGNIYLAGSTRIIYAFAKNGHIAKKFAEVDSKSGIPRFALVLSLIVSILWTLPGQFQVWGGLISAVTAATVLTYMPGPVCAQAFRNSNPNLPRPFKVPLFAIISPIAYIASTLLIYWSGWAVDEILLPVMVISWIAYAIFGKKEANDIKQSVWLLVYFIVLGVISWAGTFGGHNYLSGTVAYILVVVLALVTYFWGVMSASKSPVIADDEKALEGIV